MSPNMITNQQGEQTTIVMMMGDDDDDEQQTAVSSHSSPLRFSSVLDRDDIAAKPSSSAAEDEEEEEKTTISSDSSSSEASSEQEERQAGEEEEKRTPPCSPVAVPSQQTQSQRIKRSILRKTSSSLSGIDNNDNDDDFDCHFQYVRDKPKYWKSLPAPDLKALKRRARRAESDGTTAEEVTAATTSSDSSASSSTGNNGNVSFGHVRIRKYEQTVGDNPSCSYGTPIQFDWQYSEMHPVSLNEYEEKRGGTRRRPYQMILNYYHRRNLLTWRFGHTDEELLVAERNANIGKRQRALTKFMLPTQKVEEIVQSLVRKTKRLQFLVRPTTSTSTVR